MRVLDIDSLQSGIPFVTAGILGFYKEKCLVAFSSKGHRSGVEITIKINKTPHKISLIWSGQVNEQLMMSHADSGKTTDEAACAIALLLIRDYTDYEAYQTTNADDERFDYYLRRKNSNTDDNLIFNDAAYLEVSGIREENKDNTIERRLKQKTVRAKSSAIFNTGEPVYICIVELVMY